MKAPHQFFFDIEQYPSPPWLASIALACTTSVMLVTKVVFWSGWVTEEPEFFWITSGAFLLLFSVVNTILSLGAEWYFRYLQVSVLSFLVLLIASALFATLFSGVSIFGAGTFRSIYAILLIGYFTLLAVGMFIKFIINWLARDEERHR
jgi:hypothetical protein